MTGLYILEGHTPVTIASVLDWGRWYETADRHVASTNIAPGFWVSTVFLGFDHNWGGGHPLLFETMVFGDYGEAESFDMRRYSTWTQAERGHAQVVEAVRQFIAEQAVH